MRGSWGVEEPRQACAAAALLSQASTPLPGYLLTLTPRESLELQVSSRLLRRGHIFIPVNEGGVGEKNRGCP